MQCCPRLLILLAFLGWAGSSLSLQGEEEKPSPSPSALVVVWASGDPDVAHRVALMYAHGAQKANWFEEVRMIIWGPSQRLLAGDQDLKDKIAALREDGVIVEACVACAQTFGLVEILRKELDLPVKPMGAPLSAYLKDPDVSVITF